MGKKLLCLMLAALLGALCGCQEKAGDGSGLTSPSSVLLPPAESAPPAPPEDPKELSRAFLRSVRPQPGCEKDGICNECGLCEH